MKALRTDGKSLGTPKAREYCKDMAGREGRKRGEGTSQTFGSACTAVTTDASVSMIYSRVENS